MSRSERRNELRLLNSLMLPDYLCTALMSVIRAMRRFYYHLSAVTSVASKWVDRFDTFHHSQLYGCLIPMQ